MKNEYEIEKQILQEQILILQEEKKEQNEKIKKDKNEFIEEMKNILKEQKEKDEYEYNKNNNLNEQKMKLLDQDNKKLIKKNNILQNIINEQWIENKNIEQWINMPSSLIKKDGFENENQNIQNENQNIQSEMVLKRMKQRYNEEDENYKENVASSDINPYEKWRKDQKPIAWEEKVRDMKESRKTFSVVVDTIRRYKQKAEGYKNDEEAAAADYERQLATVRAHCNNLERDATILRSQLNRDQHNPHKNSWASLNGESILLGCTGLPNLFH